MSSATDVRDGAAGSSSAGEPLGTLGSTRSACLAEEIPVNATGTRPGTGPDKRELFTEETATVLIFPDGAVIKLSAAVATGQLIFLTNKQTNIEVVSQVVGKRVYKPTSCYVELKFTEEIAGFWGKQFPAITNEKPPAKRAAAENESVSGEAVEEMPVPGQTVEEQVESAETTEDSDTPVAAPPTGKEVEDLREEVEALRRQLAEMRRAEAAAKTVAGMDLPGERAAGSAAETASQNSVAPVVEKRQETLASVNEQTPVAPANVVAPETPAVAAPVVARTSHVGMSLPNRTPAKLDPEQEVIDQLLPQPELDFSKAPVPPKRGDWDDPYGIYKPARAKMGKQVLALLVLVLIGVAGAGALKLGLVGKFTGLWKKTNSADVPAKKNAVMPKAAEAPKPVSAPNAVAESPSANPTAPEGNVSPNPAAGTNASGAAVTEPAPVKTEVAIAEKAKPEASARGGEPASDAGKKKAAAAKSVKHDTSASRTKATVAAKKKVPVKESAEVAPAEAAPVAEDAPVLPAKLVRSVTPEYPPDAMRNFITGDVKLKGEVDDKGKIRNVEIVSGPKALRESAIEAFRQYEYEPATKGGKSVASQVKVTIKFWFVP